MTEYRHDLPASRGCCRVCGGISWISCSEQTVSSMPAGKSALMLADIKFSGFQQQLSATACGPAWVRLNDRRNNCCARSTLHTHVGRRKSMLAIPIVLRQASRPIQYPCNVERSVLATESRGVSEPAVHFSVPAVPLPLDWHFAEEPARKNLLHMARVETQEHG